VRQRAFDRDVGGEVTPDGKRFLVIVPAQSAPVRLTLIQNWTALTKR